MGPFLAVVAFIVVFALLITWGAKHAAKEARKRAAALMEMGGRYGMHLVDRIHENATHWKFTRDPINFSAKQEYPSIGIFKIYNCRYSNVMQGKDDRGQPMRTFDAQYTVSTGKSSTTYHFSIASVDTNYAFPEVAIQREGLWDKVKRLFGDDDIRTGNEEFDKTFRIECSNEAFVRSLLMSEMQEQIAAQPFTGIYLTGGKAVVLKFGLAQPAELERMLNLASIIAENAARPSEMSRVRYALEHSGPTSMGSDIEAMQELEDR